MADFALHDVRELARALDEMEQAGTRPALTADRPGAAPHVIEAGPSIADHDAGAAPLAARPAIDAHPPPVNVLGPSKEPSADAELDAISIAIHGARADTEAARGAREWAALDFARHDISERIAASRDLVTEVGQQVARLVERMTPASASRAVDPPAMAEQLSERRSAPDHDLELMMGAIAEALAGTDEARGARERAAVGLAMHGLGPLLVQDVERQALAQIPSAIPPGAASGTVDIRPQFPNLVGGLPATPDVERPSLALTRAADLPGTASGTVDVRPQFPRLVGGLAAAADVGQAESSAAIHDPIASSAVPRDIGAPAKRGFGLRGLLQRVGSALGLVPGMDRQTQKTARNAAPADASASNPQLDMSARPVEGRRAADPERARALSAPAGVRVDAAPTRDTRDRTVLAPALPGVEQRTVGAPEPAHQGGGKAPMTVHLRTLSDALDAYAKAIEAWEARQAREREVADVVEARRKAQAVARAVMAMSAEMSRADRQQVGRLHARGEALDGVWQQARARSGRGMTAGSEHRAPLPEPPVHAPTAGGPQRWTPGHIAPARRPLAGLLAHYLTEHGQDAAYADRIADLKRAVGIDAEPLAAWLVRMTAITERAGPASKSAEMIGRVVGWSAALMNVHTHRPDAELVERAYAEVMGVGQKPAPVRRRALDLSKRRERGRGYGD